MKPSKRISPRFYMVGFQLVLEALWRVTFELLKRQRETRETPTSPAQQTAVGAT